MPKTVRLVPKLPIFAVVPGHWRQLLQSQTALRRDLSQEFVSEFQLPFLRSRQREGGALKGRHFDRSVILLGIRWYLAYNLSLRNLEEMMAERGISVDQATIHR